MKKCRTFLVSHGRMNFVGCWELASGGLLLLLLEGFDVFGCCFERIQRGSFM